MFDNVGRRDDPEGRRRDATSLAVTQRTVFLMDSAFSIAGGVWFDACGEGSSGTSFFLSTSKYIS